MKNSLIYIFLIFLISCANPTMPTGGPQDKIPPKIRSTQPESGTVLFKGKEIVFHFDEYVTQASFKQAFRVEPDLDIPFSIKFSGKNVLIKFDEELPENTTLVAKINTSLSDFGNNKIKAPITLAFSTGEILNSGSIKGEVFDALSGDRVEQVKLYLYKENQSLSDKVMFVGDSDSAGVVNFSHLGSGTYRVVLVEDLNRNRKIDSFDWKQPLYEEWVRVEQDSTVKLQSVYFSKPDTIRPRLDGIGVFSESRIRLRFSEPVFPKNDKPFNVISATKNDTLSFRLMYKDENDAGTFMALTSSKLRANEEYLIDTLSLSLADAFSNPVDFVTNSFSGESNVDTTLLKIQTIFPAKSLTETDSLVVVYNGFVTQEILDSLSVIENETRIKPYPFIRIDGNRLVIYNEKPWDASLNYQFRLYNPATYQFTNFSPKMIRKNDLGNLRIHISSKDSLITNPIFIEVFGKEFDSKQKRIDSVFTFSGISDAKVTVRAFLDLNNNGKWDRGQIEPYIKPEPFFIQKDVAIREKMESDLEINF